MTIRSREAFMASLPDWGMLDGCFGETRIEPSDLDGWVERHGVFLYLEHKLPGQQLTGGMRYAIPKWTCRGDTFVAFWGRDEGGADISRVEVYDSAGCRVYDPGNLTTLRWVCARWFELADRRAA